MKAGDSLNQGAEQEALSGVAGARVEITSLAGREGLGVEFLRYLEPGPGRAMPADTQLRDLWHWEITIELSTSRSALIQGAEERGALWSQPSADGPVLLRDPDGHVVRAIWGTP